jgi:hypothetical protein
MSGVLTEEGIACLLREEQDSVHEYRSGTRQTTLTSVKIPIIRTNANLYIRSLYGLTARNICVDCI